MVARRVVDSADITVPADTQKVFRLMSKSRLEAFSDGVIAILMTIMVFDIKAPPGADLPALMSVVPMVMTYALSFLYLGIYWNNHHHMFHSTERVNGAILWANLHLLFWLSLIPITTAWMGKTDFAAWPVAIYGIVQQVEGFQLFEIAYLRTGLSIEIKQLLTNRVRAFSTLNSPTALGAISALMMVVAMVMPAEGPSFGIAPSGMCRWTSRLR